MERVAAQLIEVLKSNRQKHIVEYAERMASFKVKTADLSKYYSQLTIYGSRVKKGLNVV